jgi:hypothetical protein
MMPAQEETPSITLLVSRQSVEALDAEGVLAQIQEVTEAPNGQIARQGLALMVGGYDDDSRPLYAIPEFRHLAGLLLSQWSEWAYWLNPSAPFMRVWLLAITDGTLDGFTYAVDMESLHRRLRDGLVHMNRLCEEHGVPMHVRVQMSRGVMSALISNGAP